MAIVMTSVGNQLTELSGWDYLAQVSYGANGDIWGPMEITTTTPDYNVRGDFITWDDNPEDGVDSGFVGASFCYDESLGLGWNVDGATSTQEVVVTDGIDSVDIRSVAKGQAAILWKDAVIGFFKDGVLTEQIELGDFGADTLEWPAVEEQIISITPTNSDNDKVVIGGMVKLLAPEGTWLGEGDLFSQILIYA